MRQTNFIHVLGLVIGIYASQAKLCSPETCIKGSSHSPLVASSHSGDLVSGTYSSSDQDLTSIQSRNLTTSTTDTTTTLSLPSIPIVFSERYYHNPLDLTSSASNEDWSSAYLPDGWYGLVSPGQALWGSIPDRKELKGLPSKAKGFKEVSYDRCDPPCASGVCLPADNGRAMCTCAPGWSGGSCEGCAPGYWGPECKSCTDNCTQCDDGLTGTGSCLGTATNSIKGCDCLHGTCNAEGGCNCSAGWVSNTSTSSQKCNTCATGFFETESGDCLACPLGCTSCTLQDSTNATPACTACTTPLTLSSASPPQCISQQSCQQGQYWDTSSSTCASCSPACDTCTGPSPSQCLSCAAPRVNLAGSCVGYTASTGICDSSLSTLDGVFIVNNDKRACDACPVGCVSCSIPSYSPSAAYSTLTCSACQDGYLLESGKCVRTCTEGFFLPTGSAQRNGTCQRCDSTCSSCIGTATTCTQCPSGSFASNGSCLPTCPFRSIGTNGTCLPCSSSCGTCTTPLDSGSCTSCPSDRPVLHNSRCLTHCPRSMYYDGTTCQRCDPSCSSCLGGTSSTCSSCPDGFILESGECRHPNTKCQYVPGLGVCLKDLLDRENKSWLWFIALPFVLGVLGVLGWLYIRQQRNKRRAEVKKFGDAIDQVNARRSSGEGEGTVRLRLERVLGLNRIRVDSEQQEGKTRNLRELLLPQKGKRVDQDIKSSHLANQEEDILPPPPYSSSSTVPEDMPKRGENRPIRQSRIIDLSSPIPLLPTGPSTSGTLGTETESGPRPPPRHQSAYQVPIDAKEKQVVRFSTSAENRLDELWPARAVRERREIEGWI